MKRNNFFFSSLLGTLFLIVFVGYQLFIFYYWYDGYKMYNKIPSCQLQKAQYTVEKLFNDNEKFAETLGANFYREMGCKSAENLKDLQSY